MKREHDPAPLFVDDEMNLFRLYNALFFQETFSEMLREIFEKLSGFLTNKGIVIKQKFEEIGTNKICLHLNNFYFFNFIIYNKFCSIIFYA